MNYYKYRRKRKRANFFDGLSVTMWLILVNVIVFFVGYTFFFIDERARRIIGE